MENDKGHRPTRTERTVRELYGRIGTESSQILLTYETDLGVKSPTTTSGCSKPPKVGSLVKRDSSIFLENLRDETSGPFDEGGWLRSLPEFRQFLSS